jgi:hypothetical protein
MAGPRINLVARYNNGLPPLGVYAHMDTVPVEGDWDYDPWGEVRDGRIFLDRPLRFDVRLEWEPPRPHVAAVEHRPRARMAEVERDALLVPVERLEEERVLRFLERWHVAPDVPARRRVLDLDHLGAEIGELERTPGAGPVLLDALTVRDP